MENIQTIKNIFLRDHNFIEEPFEYQDIILYQFGEVYCDNNAFVEPHTHDNFFEISFISSGKGIFILNDNKLSVTGGDLLISIPHEKHEIISDSFEPLHYYFLSFSFKEDSDFYEILYNDEFLKLLPNKRILHEDIFDTSRLFNKMMRFFEGESKYSKMKFALNLKSSILDMYEEFMGVEEKNKNDSYELNNEKNIYHKIVRYIDENLLTIDNLSDIATALNHNYSYLSRIFKNVFGQSLNEYFVSRKIDYAKKIIKEENMSLTEVAAYLNYSSVYVFSRAFKNYTGMNPQTYKNSLKKQ